MRSCALHLALPSPRNDCRRRTRDENSPSASYWNSRSDINVSDWTVAISNSEAEREDRAGVGGCTVGLHEALCDVRVLRLVLL